MRVRPRVFLALSLSFFLSSLSLARSLFRSLAILSFPPLSVYLILTYAPGALLRGGQLRGGAEEGRGVYPRDDDSRGRHGHHPRQGALLGAGGILPNPCPAIMLIAGKPDHLPAVPASGLDAAGHLGAGPPNAQSAAELCSRRSSQRRHPARRVLQDAGQDLRDIYILLLFRLFLLLAPALTFGRRLL